MNEPTVITDRRDRRELAPAPATAVTPMDLLRVATSQGADIEKLEKLMEMQQKWEASEARKAYAAAFAAFKADPPKIQKNKHVQFATKGGDRMDYWHATHDEVCGKVAAALSAHGLAHAWRMRQEGGLIYVTCRLTHQAGHYEEFELFGNPDSSGLKSPLQAVASTITFLQRYTLLGACGLSTSEQAAADTDGGSRPTEPEPADKNAEGMTYGEWYDNLDAVPDDQLAQFDFTAYWRKAQPSWRRYVVKYEEAWWNGKRNLAERGAK
jgi:ERF superfamily protein